MPDTSTEVAIATTTLGSAASSITFSSITSAYTDLRIVLVCQTSVSANANIRFNSDTGTNYSETTLYGDGTSVTSGRETSYNQIRILSEGGTIPTSTNWSMATVDIFSYAGSTNKTILATGANDLNGSGEVDRYVGLWRNTAAITLITLRPNTGSFNTGTTATLFGIL